MLRAAMGVASLLVVSAACAAPDVPRRKSGLWETSITTAGVPAGVVSQMCIDEKSDDLAQSLAAQGTQACSKNEVRRDGNRVVTESVCRTGATTTTTRGVFTGDFASAYAGELTSSFDPPMGGIRDGKTLIKARWTGPCKADMRPGDVIMPGGMKFNVNDHKAGSKK